MKTDPRFLDTAAPVHGPGDEWTARTPDGSTMRVKASELVSALQKTKIKNVYIHDVRNMVADIASSGGSTISYTFPHAKAPRLDLTLQRHAELTQEIAQAEARLNALDFLIWLKAPFVLQRPSHSIAHKAMADLDMVPNIFDPKTCTVTVRRDQRLINSMMVEHDWAALMGSTMRTGGPDGAVEEWHLPYEDQVFEFRISGAAVLAFCSQEEGRGTRASCSLVIRTPKGDWVNDRVGYEIGPHGWTILANAHLVERGEGNVNQRLAVLMDFLLTQIRACVIMLEADVVETVPVRAPYKTNQPPKEHKPLPALSHHVLKVCRRDRPERLPEHQHVPGTRKRLHLRRGHWRHYVAHKTWIKWMLVGDPDLGFVDKEYRL